MIGRRQFLAGAAASLAATALKCEAVLAAIEDDAWNCECGHTVPGDQIVSMGDAYYCSACYAEWLEEFKRCEHGDWSPSDTQWNEPAHCCGKCSGVILDEDFPAMLGYAAPARA